MSLIRGIKTGKKRSLNINALLLSKKQFNLNHSRLTLQFYRSKIYVEHRRDNRLL